MQLFNYDKLNNQTKLKVFTETEHKFVSDTAVQKLFQLWNNPINLGSQ